MTAIGDIVMWAMLSTLALCAVREWTSDCAIGVEPARGVGGMGSVKWKM